MVSKIGICQLIASLAAASDYYLTYSFNTHNSIAYSDRVYLSRAMTPYDGTNVYTFTIDSNSSNEKEFLKNAQEKIIDEVLGYEAKIRSFTKSTTLQIYSDNTELLLPPTRIRIELNEGFAIIAIIK
ncbi:MAG: hypothetical protein RL154_911 [Pseudomonadota bacterium]